MAAPFRFDRSWRFDVTVDELWEVFSDTATYPAIWSWLDDYEAGPLESASFARFRVRPPLPYSLRFLVTLDEVVVHEHVFATVGGDVRGPARLVVSPTAEGGSQAHISWELELVRPMLAFIEPVGRRVMLWGHDLVVALGIRQFKRKALRDAR